jgi:hypothetical protein
MAELGFLGLVVNTRVHTPLFSGQFCSAGDLLLSLALFLPRRTNWLMVGKFPPVETLRIIFRKNSLNIQNGRDKDTTSQGPRQGVAGGFVGNFPIFSLQMFVFEKKTR